MIPLDGEKFDSDNNEDDESSPTYTEDDEDYSPSQSTNGGYVPVPVQDNYYQDDESNLPPEPCRACNMTGNCPVCDGSGQVMEKIFGIDEMQPCDCKACYGLGKCQGCNGTGYLR